MDIFKRAKQYKGYSRHPWDLKRIARKAARKAIKVSTVELEAEAQSDTYTGCDEGCLMCNGDYVEDPD